MGDEKKSVKGRARGLRLSADIKLIIAQYAKENRTNGTQAVERLIEIGMQEVLRQRKIVEEWDKMHAPRNDTVERRKGERRKLG